MDTMVGSVVQFFEKLITDFSWRRLGLLAGMVVLTGSALALFEWYTQTLHTSRLDREAALIERVIALDRAIGANADQDLQVAVKSLKVRVREIGQPTTNGVVLARRWEKVGYSLIPWLVLAFLMFLSSSAGAGNAILGISIFAIPLVVINEYLPDFSLEAVNNWFIPWGEAIVVVATAWWFQKRKKAPKSADLIRGTSGSVSS